MAETIVETTPQQIAPQNDAIERSASGPERLMQFLRDTRLEMHKVVTPTRAEVQTNTIVVIATVFLFAAYFAIIDNTLGRLIDKGLLKLTGH
ncbi:MAG: preprotein translocase subunit SecE [Janthinobacterium lividum]